MKISEMNNEQAADALIKLAEPFENICNDDEMLDLMEKIKVAQGKPLVKSIGDILPKLVLYALKKHRNDLYAIIGAVTMKPVGEVAKMNFKETINIVKDSYDDIVRDFFTSSVPVTEVDES